MCIKLVILYWATIIVGMHIAQGPRTGHSCLCKENPGCVTWLSGQGCVPPNLTTELDPQEAHDGVSRELIGTCRLYYVCTTHTHRLHTQEVSV